jgi:hypothetical protein
MGELVHFVDTDCLDEEDGDCDFLARRVLSATISLRARGDWKLSGLPAAPTSGRDRPQAAIQIDEQATPESFTLMRVPWRDDPFPG